MNNIKRCQECDYPNPANFTHCFKCNHDLSQPKYEEPPIVDPEIELIETPVVEEIAEPAQQNTNRHFCRMCGKSINGQESFCPNCGIAFKGGNFNNWALVILIMLVIMILSLMLQNEGEKQQQDAIDRLQGRTHSQIETAYTKV